MRSTPPSGMAILLPLILALLCLRGCPGPGPNPPPTPPGPTPVKELMVLIVEETSQRTVSQADLILDQQLRSRVAALGHRWRVVDQHAVDWDGVPARVLTPWRALPALPGGQSRGLPWLLFVRSDGSVLSDVPLSSFASAAELAAKIEALTAK